MTIGYNEDLAYVHDAGFQDYALQSMPGIFQLLRDRQIQSGFIVELGCGSGLTAEVLQQSGYQVLGIDLSAAMIAIAQSRVPTVEFRVESLWSTEIPPCRVVLAIGECLNYTFDPQGEILLESLFANVYHALEPGGVFLFDIVVPGQVAPGEMVKSFTEGEDWIILVEKSEDPIQQLLTRRMIIFRQVGDRYRRTDEVHHQRLFNVDIVVGTLKQIGFQVETRSAYGQFELPPARFVLIADKPSDVNRF